jgi:hypothetical protein
MPHYHYIAINKHDTYFHGEMDASDRENLVQVLDIQGLLLITAHAEGEPVPTIQKTPATLAPQAVPRVEETAGKPNDRKAFQFWMVRILLAAGIAGIVYGVFGILQTPSKPRTFTETDLRLIRVLDAQSRRDAEKLLGASGVLSESGVTRYEPAPGITVEFVFDDWGGRTKPSNRVKTPPKIIHH